MNSTINLPAILLVNAMGLMISVMMLVGRQWNLLGTESEKKAIRVMLTSAMISCLVDPLVFLADGKPGMLPYLTVYIGNAWLFLCNLIVGPAWYRLVISHLHGSISRRQQWFTNAVLIIGVLLLVINPFIPLVYRVDANNVYSRGSFFWLYMAADAFFMFEGVAAYLMARKKGGALLFFPVWQFILPAAAGAAIQGAFYGISSVWPCLTISINGMLFCLQSEAIYRDKLTGLFNRNYLETLYERRGRRSLQVIAAMMIDLNDFKSINDRFGHTVGDQALIECGNILRESVGTRGSVIRYAGDEFIVLLNTQGMDEATEMAQTIRENFTRFNEAGTAPYELSASIGCSLFDFSRQTPDQLLSMIDSKMYDDKQSFYRQHPELDRRKRDL